MPVEPYLGNRSEAESRRRADESLQRLAALHRRERWMRHGLVIGGIALMVFYLLLVAISARLSVLGLIIVPLSGFFLAWGLIREAIAFMASR